MSEHSTNTAQYDIVVVGGGIAGLVAGVTAAEGGARVVLIDSTTLGGRAKTAERDGYRYNVGPHALYLAGHLHPFLASRGLAPAGDRPPNKGGRVLRDGQLWPLGYTATDLARTKLLSARGRMRLLALLAKLPRMKTAEFVGVPWAQWLGNEPADVAGVIGMLGRVSSYVNAPDSSDAAAALTQLQAALKGVLYLDGGWQTMVDALAARLVSLGGVVAPNETVLAVEPGLVRTSERSIATRAAIIAGLAPDAAARLAGAPVTGVENLGDHVQAAVLDVALDRVHRGVVFGIDRPLYLSPHAPVARLAPEGRGLVTAMRYVPVGEPAAAADEDREELRRLVTMAGIAPEAIVHERYLHRLVVANGFPTAHGGGLAGRPRATALGVEGVYVAGDWVGPRGQLVDASSASAEDAARHALAHIAKGARVAV